MLATWKMGGSRPKAHLPVPVPAEVFIRREGDQDKVIRGGVCKVLYMQMVTVLSAKAGDSPLCVIPASHHPGPIVEGQQIPRSWDA